MFDGNYRSRRQVDLSGSRRRKTAGNKPTEGGGAGGGRGNNRSTILEESRRLREERLKQQEQHLAAQSIQRVYRGDLSRRKLVRQLEQRLTSAALRSLSERTTCLNARLSYRPLHPEFVLRSLQDYAQFLRSSELMTTCPLAHRIVRSSLCLMKARQISTEDVHLILNYTLNTQSRLLQLGREGLILLLEVLQTLDHNNIYLPLKSELWELAIAATPSTVTGQAALGAVALSHKDIRSLLGSADGKLNGYPSFDVLRKWFSCMVQVISSSTTTSSTLAATSPPAYSVSDPLVATVLRMQERRNSIILANAMTLYHDSHSPAPLVRYLQRFPDSLLAVCGFLVRGDTNNSPLDWNLADAPAPASSSKTSMETETRDVSYNNEDGDDDDDDDDYSDPGFGAPFRSVGTSAAAVGGADKGKPLLRSRLAKQDLQTLQKIDRSYNHLVNKLRSSVLDQVRREGYPVAMEIAHQICVPHQWLQWGKALFSSLDSSEEALQAQEAYVKVLATLLQTCTGLSAKQSVGSPFLTALAMDTPFLERLWRYVMVQQANNSSQPSPYLAMSLFCDVFAHRLVAMKDDQFLRDYTNAYAPCVISAEHVIVKLRDMLYELYWSKPVRAVHVVPMSASLPEEDRTEAMRGRLLLTGTKLWQSLYERWCRLVRHAPFCDESTWWFPHMSTLSTEETGVWVRNSGHHHPAGEADMDLESSDDDEEVEQPMMSADAESEALAEAFSDPKMARILTCIPQALPFDRRVKLFHSLLASDKIKTQDEASEMRQAMLMIMRGEEGEMSTRERVAIHRDRLYDDSMRQLNQLGPKLKKRVQVSFINQHGQHEAGIDGGGVFKEFIDDLIKEAFSFESTTSIRLFSVTPLQTLTVNTNLPEDDSLLTHYEFLGRVLGKAVYESILVEPQFCLPFLNQLLGKANSLEDLKNFDVVFYQNLTKLLTMPPEELDNMGLTFELSLGEGARMHTVELMRGGRNKLVSKANVIHYVHLVAHQRLNVEGAVQTKAFLRGFRDLIPASWVRLFSAYELQKLISGDDSIRGIDVTSLKTAMQYAGGYHPSQPVIQWFWEILEEMPAEQQRKFLKFMTSCSRQPLLGFASLEPAPCIQQIRLPEEMFTTGDAAKGAPLPTSSTCMNLLKLPNYRNKELMKKKLCAAIESGAGFELT